MNKLKTLLTILLVLTLLSSVSAQGKRRKSSATAKPTAPPVTGPTEPTSKPTAAVPPSAPVLLAVVNGQNVTSAEIDPRVRQEVEKLDARINETRQQVLEMEINTLLLASEAAKRRTNPQQLYDTEVTRKIVAPPAAEVSKFMEDNRGQLDQGSPAEMRQQVVDYLRGEREAAISEQFVKKLRATNPVVKRVDLSSPSLTPATVVATVSGVPITAGPVIERLKPVIYKFRLSAYRLQKEALDRTINDLLLLDEAKRRNVEPEEIVRKEITEQMKPPTEAEVAKFYSENKARLTGDLDSLRNQIANYLQEKERERLERAFAERLRKGANVRVLISEPVQPVQLISTDDDPFKGKVNAPVTIVEFTDFQCPSCAAMHPVLDEALKSYGDKVRLVVRDFPLAMHANARKAAEAANAANAQGKFFEYAAVLFKHQNELDVPSLKKYASELGLDRKSFDAALDSGKYAIEIRKDVAEGELYGVESTPTIFVNGVALKSLSGEALRAAIDKALGQTGTSTMPTKTSVSGDIPVPPVRPKP